MIHLLIIDALTTIALVFGLVHLWKRMNRYERMCQGPIFDDTIKFDDSAGVPGHGVPLTEADAKIIMDEERV